MTTGILFCLVVILNPLRAGMLMKIDYVGASRAQRAPSPSGFSHPYSVEAPFNLWYEPLDEYTRHIVLRGLIISLSNE